MFGYRRNSQFFGGRGCFVLFFVVVFAGMFWFMPVSGRVFVKIMLDFGGDRFPQLYF